MTTQFNNRGFTLIELLVVAAIIGILAAIAYPAFIQMLIGSDRADGRQALLAIAMGQERFHAANATYTTDIGSLGVSLPGSGGAFTSERGLYNVSVTAATRGEFTATASAVGKQTKDAVAACQTLSVTVRSGSSASKAPAECW